MSEPSEAADRCAKAVIGCAIEVHRTLGPGFLEAMYEQALAFEFGLRGLSFQRQPAVDVAYKGQLIGHGRLDFLVERTLVIELKTVDQLAPIHTAQVMSYLKALRLDLGLLFNFNVPTLVQGGIKRIVLTRN